MTYLLYQYSLKADKALSEAESQRGEANKYAQDTENFCAVMDAVITKAEQIKNLLVGLSSLKTESFVTKKFSKYSTTVKKS